MKPAGNVAMVWSARLGETLRVELGDRMDLAQALARAELDRIFVRVVTAPRPWWLRVLPSLITLAGHVATVAWLAGGPWWLALVGLALDVLDGTVARRLHVTSAWGGLYDWLVDSTAAAILVASISPFLLLVLVPAQVHLRHKHVRISGRAALTLGVLAWRFLQP
jgi:hypothetical protein